MSPFSKDPGQATLASAEADKAMFELVWWTIKGILQVEAASRARL